AAGTANDQLAEAETVLCEALVVEQNAADEREKAVLASTVFKADRDEKRAAYEALGPQLDEAQRLDAVIETTRTELAKRAERVGQCVRDRNAAGTAVTAAEARLTTVRHQREADHCWLGTHKSVEALSARLEDVTKNLLERSDLEAQI